MIRRLLSVLLLALPTWAHQEPQDQPEGECDYFTILQEGDQNVIFAAAPVVRRGDVVIRAESMILWTPKGKSEFAFEELYAEGNVSYQRGTSQVRADRLYYNAKTDRAFVFHIRARGRSPVGDIPIQIQAEQAREVAKGHFVADDVSISSCEYGVPHFDVHVGQGDLIGRPPRKKDASTYDLFPYDNWTLVGRNLTPRILKFPFFYIPGISISSGILDEFPLRSIRGGQTSRFGYFAYSTWGFTIRKGAVDRVLPWENATTEDDAEKLGDIEFNVDWREERGGGYGINLKWGWDGYAGYLNSYYLHDLGRSENEFDQKFAPLERPERGRARLFHRHDFLPEWRYEIEASYVSDGDLLEEFFEHEFKEDKEQESAVYLRWRHENWGAYALERPRLNSFQTQVEYLPRLHFEVVDQPVFWDRLLFTNTAEVSHQRLLVADDTTGDEATTWRLDSLNELAMPLDLSVLSIAPFGSGRGTLDAYDLEGDLATRWVWSAGARARMDIHGVHDLTIEDIGLRRVKHILQLEARAAANLYSNKKNDELFRFDAVDRIDEFQEVAFKLRNRFQTKVWIDGKLATWEFLDFGLQIEWYPRFSRDTVAFNENNFFPPFHWIPLAPLTTAGDFPERRWSDLAWDFRLQPRNFFGLQGRGQYNPEFDQEERREFSVSLQPLPSVSVSVGSTYLREVTNAYTAGLDLRIAEKWTVSLRTQYDFRASAFTQQQLIVGRDLHDFILEAVLEDNPGRDEFRVFFGIVPKFLANTKLSTRSGP